MATSEDPQIPTVDDPTILAWVLCTVWAWDPDFQVIGVDRMEAEASHFCSGNWISHKVKGQLLRHMWGPSWRIEDSESTPWDDQNDVIWVSLRQDCYNDGWNTWKTKARGWVEYSGGYDIEDHISEEVEEPCGI